MEALAVGFFDGVHLGHQAILRRATAVLTFARHPLSVLAPGRAPRLVMTCEERVAAIRACGVPNVTVLDFTAELAALSPSAFVSTYVAADKVLCGENWRFGRGGSGDAAFLRACGIETEVVPYAVYRSERISSSRIRAALEGGEIEDANAMMGHPFAPTGLSQTGKGMGRELGYPTINFRLPTLELNLRRGVYEVELSGRRGVANYGVAPTMGAAAWPSPVLEVHLVSPDADFLSRLPNPTPVSFLRFLRPERVFDSAEALKRQIAEDCRKVNE